MKIGNIEIKHLRGIKNLSLDFAYENSVIWGPNGSGKSAVVDAIDFLLTGKIPRLTGEGTLGINISRHGPHIDHINSPESVSVKATISIPGIKEPITLSRCMADPGKLAIQGTTQEKLNEILSLAARRQHSLSRKEILTYIAAKAGVRSSEVQAVLDLKELEETRKSLVTVAGKAKDGFNYAQRNLKYQESVIAARIGEKEFSEERLLKAVNDSRAMLGANRLSKINTDDLKKDVRRPEKRDDEKAVNPDLIHKAIESLSMVNDQIINNKIESEEKLRQDIINILYDTTSLDAFERMKLLESGINKLDGSGTCPLCGYEWNAKELQDRLNERLDKAKKVAPKIEQVNSGCKEIRDSIIRIHTSLLEFKEYSLQLQLEDIKNRIMNWCHKLDKYINACNEPLKDYLDSGMTTEEYAKIIKGFEYINDCKAILKKAKELVPVVTPEQTAWDTLTGLEATLPQYYSASIEYDRSLEIKRRADALNSQFESVREKRLGVLYDSIGERFTEFYKALHSGDEEGFDATLKPDGKFAVDFYGRGQHPPLALHSEGHQDSMGLCLFLALAEKLTKGKCQLTVLDDVVMSVDAGHRKQVCKLLKTFFPDRQFLITTHDRTWARQMKIEGVVKKSGCFEFNRWNIDTGPNVEIESEMWANIEKDLAKHNVPQAAFKLRNGSESFFESVCDSLKAKVQYRSDGHWELGDFMHASIAEYGHLLKIAKKAAQSWEDQKAIEKLNELDSIRSQIIRRTYCDQWMVNASVHYSKWHELSVGDFKSIVEAFGDCFSLFQCQKCGGMIYLVEDDKKPAGVRCACLNTDWNLSSKT